jgi:hypothetical protein
MRDICFLKFGNTVKPLAMNYVATDDFCKAKNCL